MSPAPATAQQQRAKVPVFVWEAKTKNGEIKKGEMEAADQEAVNSRLRSMGYQPVKVKKKPLEISFSLPGLGGVSQKDLVIFTRTFATMIDAGLPLVQCLELLAGQTPNPAFKKVLFEVKAKVEAGSTFAEALKEHPKVFDQLYVHLVSAGEIGGILDTILNRLAAYIEKNQKLVRKVKGALTYPVLVIGAGVLVMAVLLVKVIPTFEKMFKDFGGALPAPTQIVVDLSKWMQAYIFHVIVGIVLFIVLFRLFLSNKNGRILWDKFVLRVPVIGDVIRKVAVARFTRTLGTMISSGVPILDALDVVARTAGNKTIETAIQYTRSKITEGKTIAAPLMETKVFPQMVVQMIGVGEATGAMDQMLNKIADFYDDEAEVAIESLTSMIEPFIMVFLGGGVGGMLIAMYLPIFSVAGAIK
ncbi:MAG TPA: pilus assembly protein PilC [Myxococcales bacterium]|jgi:type IV pilus assembly protein PilC|nr:pilus assembly protein PilC [Myxococcales bacterium]